MLFCKYGKKKRVEKIRGLREVGYSIKDIVRPFNRSCTCVQAVLQLQQVKSTSNRPTFLTSRELRRVMPEATTGSHTSIQLADKMELKCSARTVRRILLDVDWLVYTKMDCTSHLTRKNMKEIQLWAKSHVMIGSGLICSYFLG